MTEEEIRPIAEDYVEEYCHCPDGEYTDGSLVCAGIGTALIVSRQLEKQIEIDAEQIRALQKQNGELTDKVNELEHQLTHRNCLDCSNHSSKLRMRNLELEKENAELKQGVEKHKWNDIFLGDCADYDKKIAEEYTTLQERIAELERENADLHKSYDDLYFSMRTLREENAEQKADLDEKENTVHTLDVLHKEAVRKYGEVNDQLTNAKLILEEICNAIPSSVAEYIKEPLKKAEQFLRGEK